MNRGKRFREAKKEEGFTQHSIWLAPEEHRVIELQVAKTGMTKQDVIRQALRAYAQDQRMTAG